MRRRSKAHQPIRLRTSIILSVGLVALIIGCVSAVVLYRAVGKPLDDIVRYVERRLEGHSMLERVLVPMLEWVRINVSAVPTTLGTPRATCLDATPAFVEKSQRLEHTVPVRASRSRAATLRVGPGEKLTRIALAAQSAKEGDVIEVEAGTYLNDVATWNQSSLTIRAVGGRAKLVSQGPTAEDKAIWVINGDNVVIENFEFSGARVADRNGAGIRHQAGKLIVRNSVFTKNDIGIVSSNNESSELVVERSEFCANGGDAAYKQTDPGHQIYVGTIRRFMLSDSYVHQGVYGHLVKSRAQENRIFYNRLTDEVGGRASYEIDLPNGGLAYVVGNIIGQSSQSDNPAMISFGEEGYRWPRNEFYLVNNTLVDDLPSGGTYLKVKPGASNISVVNNVLLGNGDVDVSLIRPSAGNTKAEWSDMAHVAREDYHLKKSSRLIGSAVDPGEVNGVNLRPQREYVHPLASAPIPDSRLNPGALQTLAP